MSTFNMSDIGGVMPSGSPRNVPTDPNGQAVALAYYQASASGVPIPASNFHGEYIRPSGALLGATGRESSYGAVNVGQFKTAAFCLDVTAMTRDDSDESLDVVLETSYNQGNSWVRFARFKTIETTGAQTQVIIVEPSGGYTLLEDCESSDPSSGQVLATYLGDKVRTGSTFTDPAGDDSEATFSVYGVFKR